MPSVSQLSGFNSEFRLTSPLPPAIGVGGSALWEYNAKRVIYSFTVVLPVVVDSITLEKIKAVIDFMKPAHTHYRIVQPNEVGALDHWLLDISSLDINTLLH